MSFIGQILLHFLITVNFGTVDLVSQIYKVSLYTLTFQIKISKDFFSCLFLLFDFCGLYLSSPHIFCTFDISLYNMKRMFLGWPSYNIYTFCIMIDTKSSEVYRGTFFCYKYYMVLCITILGNFKPHDEWYKLLMRASGFTSGCFPLLTGTFFFIYTFIWYPLHILVIWYHYSRYYTCSLWRSICSWVLWLKKQTSASNIVSVRGNVSDINVCKKMKPLSFLVYFF